MAKVKITGHASGTGILTVTAPNTSTDRTVTLPDATGTLLNSDGSGASLTALNATQLTSGTVPGARLSGITVARTNVTTEGQVEASTFVTADGNADVNFGDNEKIRMGTGVDLEIYHDGSNSYIHDSGTGDLIIKGAGDVRIKGDNDETLAIFGQNAACYFYFDGVKKLETNADGIEIQGKIEMGGNLHITGEGGSDRLTIHENTGAVWIDGSCSAASFIDRTPYPETLQLAYDVINSHQKLPADEYKVDDQSKQLDHTKLHEYVKGEEKSRNMSGVISCLVEVIKDLSTKNTALEARITALENA